jgi:hypothetical protein
MCGSTQPASKKRSEATIPAAAGYHQGRRYGMWLLMLVLGCGEPLTGQGFCVEYYDTMCACGDASEDTCTEQLLTDEWCSGADAEKLDDQRERICVLDGYAATCDEQGARDDCE